MLARRCGAALAERGWEGDAEPADALASAIGDEDEDEDDSRWSWVDAQGSRQGYRDMELFIGTVDDPALADRLSTAIAGRGAFSRFRHTIAADPGAEDRWYTFSEDRLRGRARSWLAGQGYTPTTARRP